MKTRLFEHFAYKIEGTALISLWGGGQGTTRMKAHTIEQPLTKQAILKAINDGGFGCIRIEAAEVDILEIYRDIKHRAMTAVEYNRTFWFKFNKQTNRLEISSQEEWEEATAWRYE